jgi:hypothetical protein
VVDIYFLVWSLSRLLCCVGSGSNVAAVFRRMYASALLLRLGVRIPPGAYMFVVGVVCCQAEVSTMSLSRAQRSPADCGASLVVI